MYAYIRGKLTHLSSVFAVVESGGIGYQINIPASAISNLPSLGSETMLYTSFVVREQSQALFGFLTLSERELFDILLQITGIGPKTALSLIGHMSTHEFIEAVKEEDIKKICKIPGIGKKTAERLFLEIRDKLTTLYGLDPSQFTLKGSTVKVDMVKDAISGLINLGYNQANASKAIQKALDENQNSNLSELITQALRYI